ncbi:hypothetical protein ACGFYQ_36495 [Streptomyces sp. NPDC048258]|uniref:hypothetical protein n=1 Tax=Streptomyces sp. NPDC048258 TaxID=3365527 RepID=UPI00372335C4
MSAIPVPVDEHGIDARALSATEARAVVAPPAHQWPNGAPEDALPAPVRGSPPRSMR